MLVVTNAVTGKLHALRTEYIISIYQYNKVAKTPRGKDLFKDARTCIKHKDENLERPYQAENYVRIQTNVLVVKEEFNTVLKTIEKE